MEENKRISDLFERARTEAPKTSFDELKGHFLATSSVVGVGFMAKWAAASFKLKVIIMTSALITLTISGLIVSSVLTSEPLKNEANDKKEVILPMENVEVTQEDGIKETIVYDEKDQVVEIIVDSSSKSTEQSGKSGSGAVLELTPQQLKSAKTELNKTLPAPTKVDRRTSEGEKEGKEHRFEITEKTTVKELEEMQKEAKKAGIQMKYNARVKKNLITRLSMTWMLVDENGKSNWQFSVNGEEEFQVEVGWRENKEGQAIEFLNDSMIQSSNLPVEIIVDKDGNLIRSRN